MLAEALTALAGAGATAVVQAAGTDAWAGLRQRVAQLLGRDDPERVRAGLERLDQTAAVLGSVSGAELELARTVQQEGWRGRFETLLENLDEHTRAQVAMELRALVAEAGGATGGTNPVSGNTFHAPTAIQVGDHNRQNNNFGSRA